MPTGYTAEVQDGTVTDFSVFALRCARAFGALVTMRDDRMDTPIPVRIEPSSYHADRITEAAADVQRLSAMSPSEIKQAAADANAAELTSWFERLTERRTQRQRYEAMLANAKSWTPPTSEHVELKKFMLEQLQTSIDVDCSDQCPDPQPELLSADTWHKAQLAEAGQNLVYHEKKHREEVKRAVNRTEWLRALRASLNGSSAIATPPPSSPKGETK